MLQRTDEAILRDVAVTSHVQLASHVASLTRNLHAAGDHPWIWIVHPSIVFPVTLRVLWREVAHVTVRVFRIVVTPFTARVLLRVEAHDTLRVFARVVAPVTQSVPCIIEFHVVRRDPLRSRLYPGLGFQIPTNEPVWKRRDA